MARCGFAASKSARMFVAEAVKGLKEVEARGSGDLQLRFGIAHYFGIHVKGLCSIPSASHFLQSNFVQLVKTPSMRLSDKRSISTSSSRLHQLVTFCAY